MSELAKTKEIVNPSSIIIATSTMYPGWSGDANIDSSVEVRGRLALKTIKEAVSTGYKVILVDGGSGDEFTNGAKDLGAQVLMQETAGMSPGRRQVFKEASILPGAKVICWIEPEKVSVIKDCLPYAIFPIINDEADIVIPKRDENSFLTYPDYQAGFEKRSNRLWNRILKKHGLLSETSEDLDAWFGPRFFRNDPNIINLFLKKYSLTDSKDGFFKNVNPEDWANATFLPIMAALKRGYRVKNVTVSYKHPHEQTKIEQDSEYFRKKRFLQFRSIISTTAEFIKFLEGNPKTRIQEID